MPLIFSQLKTIYSPMTSFLTYCSRLKHLFLYSVLFVVFPLCAQAFDWPFSTEEFQKKLTSQDLTISTRYFARGPSFLKGQIWNESRFLSQLQQQNYRLREAQQVILAGDAKKLTPSDCKILIQNSALSESSTCWMWQNHLNETYLVVVNAEQIIESTWLGSTPEAHWKAALDPILIAQYKGQQPIMQNELKISDMPVNCLNAVMAIEDSEFLNHSGLSYIGLTRSLLKNISKMRYAQGGSTITQQLVKNYFLTPEKTLSRKLKELYLAVKLESEWTKDQILETYLNIIYMGQSGAFQVLGFGAASTYYFNKKLPQLNLPECALTAAIINNPGTYNPWKNPDKARTRRNLVLTKMKDLNLITATEYQAAIQEALPAQVKTLASETAPYFFDAVRRQLASMSLPQEPASIYTSLDLQAQQNAQTSLQEQISQLEKNRKNLAKNKASGLKLQGLVLSSENQTGLVNALVGGQNYRESQFNRALNGKRQMGSLIKPFVYLTALMQGSDPLTKVLDEKFTWKYDKQNWSPHNDEKTYFGEIPFYYGLVESLNVATARLAQQVGLDQFITLAHSAGLTSDIPPIPSSSLGTSTHFPLEVLDSYRTLANMGQFTQSSFIERILSKDGSKLFDFHPAFEQKLDPLNTAVLVGIMQETIKSGTAKSAKSMGWTLPSAGKTGTSSYSRDAWFAGFTPYQTVVVWLGYDQGQVSSQLYGASGGLPAWVALMKNYTSIWPPLDFNYPEGVEKREVDQFGTDKKTELIFKK
jgi:penicillin-binding protein 1B